MLDLITNFLYAIIRISTPIIFVAIGSTISQQAGLMNMAGESMMLASSLTGVIMSALFDNVWLGILFGILASVAVTLVICFAAFVMKVDLYLMSISMNLALGGATVFIMWVLTGTKANTAGTIHSLSLGNINIPLVENIPILGAIVSGHNMFTYIAVGMAFAVWFLLFRTKLGLRMRAIGQNAKAAESVGINTKRVYTIAFVIASIVSSFGGMYLSMGYQNFFAKAITANRGFVGMAASTVANAQPIGALLVSFAFGLAYAVSNYLTPFITDAYLMQAMPFLLVVLIYMVMAAWRSGAESRLMRKKRRQLLQMEGEQS